MTVRYTHADHQAAVAVEPLRLTCATRSRCSEMAMIHGRRSPGRSGGRTTQVDLCVEIEMFRDGHDSRMQGGEGGRGLTPQIQCGLEDRSSVAGLSEGDNHRP